MGAMRKSEQDRARSWGRALATLERSQGLLFVDAPGVWAFPPSLLSAQHFLEGMGEPPNHARRIYREELDALRLAVATVRRARSLDEARQRERALRRWRRADVDSLVEQGESFAECLGWALAAADGPSAGPRPRGVLMQGDQVDADASLRRFKALASLQVSVVTDLVASRIVGDAIVVAERLYDAFGVEAALRWLETAEGRWWPDPATRTTFLRWHQQISQAGSHALQATLEEASVRLRSRIPEFDIRTDLRQAATAGAAAAALWRAFDSIADDSIEDRTGCMRLIVRTGSAPFPIPSETSPFGVKRLADILESASDSWTSGVAAHLAEWLRSDEPPQKWVAELSPGLAKEVMRRWPVCAPGQRGWQPNRLRRYLRAIDLADARGATAGHWLRQPWAAAVFASEFWQAGLGLVVAAEELTEGVEDAAAALASTSALAPGSAVAHQALLDWSRPRLDQEHGELDDIADSLGVPKDELVHYLHFKRLAGDAEALPRFLTDLLVTDEPAQVDAIRHQLTFEQPSDRAALLREELRRLTDPVVAAGRHQARVRQARNRLRRASAQHRLTSLRMALMACAAQVTGLAIDERLDARQLSQLIWFGSDSSVRPDLLARFLQTLRRQGTFEAWPENAEWCESQRERFDVDRWLPGFDVTVNVVGTAIRYHSETNPVHAAHMGTMFDTCLR